LTGSIRGEQNSHPVDLHEVSKSFRVGERIVTVLDRVSIWAGVQEFVTLIGPSGCGKSTLLNIVSGLLLPDSGHVVLRGSQEDARLGTVSYMPQKDLLLPWRSVLDNILLGPEIQRVDLKAARAEAQELLPLFGLEGFGNSYPLTLSGGMRQRAALMRTFMQKRDVMLLDEPLGALDALTRRTMRQWLLHVWRRLPQTVLFVTHDVDEAILLSDRVYVFSPRPGRIVDEVVIDVPRPRADERATSNQIGHYRARLLEGLGL